MLAMVPLARLERARLATNDFESFASTNSATGAPRRATPLAAPRPLFKLAKVLGGVDKFRAATAGGQKRQFKE